MTNHVHILLTPSDSAGCSQLMKHTAQRHSRKINAKRVRTGTLWEGRFYSGLVGSEDYALACYRYIELNPVRAQIVQLPALYQQDVIDEIRKATRSGHRMGDPRKPRGRPQRSAENGDCHQLKMVTVTI